MILFVLTVWISAKRGLLKPTLKLLRLAVCAVVTTLVGSLLASRLEYYLMDGVTQQVMERMPQLPLLATSLSRGIATALAILISYSLLFLLSFALMTLLIRLLMKLSHLPILSSVDKILGVVLGIAFGGLAVAALSSLLRVGLVAAGQEELVAASMFLSLFRPAP